MIFFILGAACILCFFALPLRFDIQGENVLRIRVHYLCFSFNFNGLLKKRTRKHFVLEDFTKNLGMCVSFVRHPMRVMRFRLKVLFSTGDAAETALLHGFLCAFFRALYPRISACKPEIILSPCFSSYDKLSIDCDISFSLPMLMFLARACSPR
ncbi:MAG: hypothetical protein LBK66_03835 [Spirochaetaceae bacterium]|nr:hypothetical protein [Spirochaetaceae bacterium]